LPHGSGDGQLGDQEIGVGQRKMGRKRREMDGATGTVSVRIIVLDGDRVPVREYPREDRNDPRVVAR
jgi:hypothetical protein